jgi:hypothetical protein
MLSADPAQGLKMWQALPRSERLRLDDLGAYDPERDATPPPGGLILKVFARPLVRDVGGRLQLYLNPKAHLSREPGRDFLWLTRAELQSLLPARPKEGAKLRVPAALADRFCRRYLIDLVRIGGNGGPRQPEDVLAEELWLTVEAVTPGAVRLRLHGSARFVTRGPEHGAPGNGGRVDEFRVLGFLTQDRGKQQLTRFDAVALSEAGHFDEIGRRLLPLGVAFGLTRGEAPADRVRPSSFYHEYFGKRN